MKIGLEKFIDYKNVLDEFCPQMDRLVAEAIERVYKGKSVSELFEF